MDNAAGMSSQTGQGVQIDSAGVAMGSGSDSLEREPFFAHALSKSFVDMMLNDDAVKHGNGGKGSAQSRGDLEKYFTHDIVLAGGES